MKKFLWLLSLFFCSCTQSNLAPLQPTQKFPQIIQGMQNAAGPLEKENPLFIRGMPPDFIRDGWKSFWNFKQSQGTSMVDKFVNFKPDAILIHLPFGRTDGRDFDLADFQAGKADPRLKNVFNIPDFIETMVDLHHRTGNVPMYFYLGYVGGVAEYWNGLSESEKLKKMLEALDPYVQLQKRLKTAALPIPVHIIIDTMAIRYKGDINFDVLLPLIKKLGFGYGGEAWPTREQTEAKTFNYQTVVLYSNLTWMDPSLNPNDWAMPQADIKGPIFPWIDTWIAGETERDAAARAAYLIERYGHVIWGISWEMKPMTSGDIRNLIKYTAQ